MSALGIPTYRLQRVAQSKDGTLGRLLGFYTIEEEAHDPLGHSRIPAGIYLCRKSYFITGAYWTWEITGVRGRSRILFHIANTEEDVEGCVGIGLGFGRLLVTDEETGVRRRKIGVVNSRRGFNRFHMHLQGLEQWYVDIRDPVPEIGSPTIHLVHGWENQDLVKAKTLPLGEIDE